MMRKKIFSGLKMSRGLSEVFIQWLGFPIMELEPQLIIVD